MHLYLRLMPDDGDDSAAAQERLGQALAGAPGVACVKTLGRHIKGGFAVTLDVSQESMEPLVELLASRGLRAVI